MYNDNINPDATYPSGYTGQTKSDSLRTECNGGCVFSKDIAPEPVIGINHVKY